MNPINKILSPIFIPLPNPLLVIFEKLKYHYSQEGFLHNFIGINTINSKLVFLLLHIQTQNISYFSYKIFCHKFFLHKTLIKLFIQMRPKSLIVIAPIKHEDHPDYKT